MNKQQKKPNIKFLFSWVTVVVQAPACMRALKVKIPSVPKETRTNERW